MAKKIKGKDFFDASVQKSIDKVIQRLKEVDKEYGQLTKELEKNKASLKRYSQTNSKLAKTAEKTNAVMKEATAISKAQLKADAKLAMAESKQAKKLAETKEKIRAKNQEVKQSIALGGKHRMSVTAQNSSLNTLEKALAMNRAAYKNMSAAERNNAKQGGRLNAVIKKQAAEVDRLRTSMGQAQQRVGGYSEAMKKMRGGVMQARMKIMALVASFGMLIRVGKKSIEDYDNEIKAQKALSVALGKTSKKLEKQASALQVRTRYGNEEILQGEAYLAQMGATEKQIEKITPLILDMAEAQGMKANDAFKLMGKTLGSSTNALSRYGIQVEGAVGSDERLESAVASLSKAFKGQAEAAAGVGTGAIQQLKNAYGDLREQIGRFILRGINPLVKGMKKEIEYRTKLADIGNRRKEIEEESVAVNHLASKLKDENIEQKDRVEYVSKLKQIAPEYFGNLDSEKTKYSDIADEVKKFNDRQVKRLVLLSYEQEQIDAVNETVKKKKKLDDLEYSARKTSTNQIKNLIILRGKLVEAGESDEKISYVDNLIKEFERLSTETVKSVDDIDDYVNEVFSYSQKLTKATERGDLNLRLIFGEGYWNKVSKDVRKLRGDILDANQDVGLAYSNSSTSFEKWIKQYKEAAEESDIATQLYEYYNNELENGNKIINETTKVTGDNVDATNDFNIELAKEKDNWEETTKALEAYIEKLKKLNAPFEDADWVKKIKEDFENAGAIEPDINMDEAHKKIRKQYIEQFGALKYSLKELQYSFQNIWEEGSIEAINKYAQAGMDAINGIADVQQAFYSRRMEQHQADLHAIQEDYGARIEAAEGNAEEQDRLREEQRQAEKQIQEQILAEKQKQAKIDKQIAAFNAAINGAVTIIKAWAVNPVIGALTAAAVAAQIAAIEARPIPQFYKGTEDHPGGASLVGERGKELYITPSGMAGITPDTATVMDFPKGTHIFTHEDTKRYLAGAAKEKKHDMQISQKDYTMYFKKLIRNTGKETNINVSGGNDDYKKRYVN